MEGNATDLACFADASFDLVLNMDGAISFCSEAAEAAIQEACRVTRRTLIVTVSHRARMIPVWIEASLLVYRGFSDAVAEMLYQGRWHQDQFLSNARLSQGATDNYLGPLKAFLPSELRAILAGAGLRVLRCGGLGSLAGQCAPETLQRLQQVPALWEKFLDLCDYYDREILVDGPGTRQRAGLIAVAERV
jgi:hypothetical protein